MKSIFEASNSIEAHMIKSLLHINEIESEVFGDHLQGGIGELQAIGVVRVMVAENDAEAAYEIIREWESSQPVASAEAEASTGKSGGGIGAAIVGFIAGAAAVLLYLQSTVEHSGLDYDNDGKLDVQYRYVNSTLRSMKTDRNLDGELDQVIRYTFDGRTGSASLDEDFDGRYETRCQFKFNEPVSCETDADGDKFYEYRERYAHGVLDLQSSFNSKTKKLVKTELMKFDRVVHTELDLDGDGVLETRYEHDALGERISN